MLSYPKGRTVWFASAIALLALVYLLVAPRLPVAVAPPRGARLDLAVFGTLKLLGAGLLFGLPPGLVLGVPAGLRPGSTLDRLLQALAGLLAWTPVTILYMAVVYVALLRWQPAIKIAHLSYLVLTPVFAGWLGAAIRDGLAGARGMVLKGALRSILGRLGQRFGSLLAVVMLADVMGPPKGLGSLLTESVTLRQWNLVLTVVALVAAVAMVVHWAGDLAVGAEEPVEQAPSRAGAGWLVAYGLLALVLVAFALSSFKPHVALDIPNRLQPSGAGHPLGTDQYGRDNLARIAAGARNSLWIALGALLVAGMGGAALGAASRRLGTPFRSERAPSPDLLFPFLGALAACLWLGPKPWFIMLGAGLGAAPTLVQPGRLGRGRLGSCLLVVAQVLMATSMLDFLGIGQRPPVASLGTNAAELVQFVRPMSHLLWVHLLLGVSIAGFYLAGRALTAEGPSAEMTPRG